MFYFLFLFSWYSMFCQSYCQSESYHTLCRERQSTSGLGVAIFLLPVYSDVQTAWFCSHATEIPRKFGNICWNSPAARDIVSYGLDVCDIYFRYKTTSYNTNLSTVELLDLENIGIAVGICYYVPWSSRYDVSHKWQQTACILPVFAPPYWIFGTLCTSDKHSIL